MIIKLFIRNALDATKLHAHFQKFSGVTPPTPQGLAKAQFLMRCIKRSNKTRKGPKFGSSSPIIFSFLRHWRVMMFFAYGEGREHSQLW